MPLNPAATASDIVAAQNALPPEASESDRMTAFISALYARIVADAVISTTDTGVVTSGAGAGGATTGTGVGTIS